MSQLPNTPNETEALVRIEKYASKSRQFTINDAVASTGVPVLESEYAIKSLMDKYDCRLKVTENGDLIYDFGRMERRHSKGFGEYMRDFGAWLWGAFTLFYKFTISVVLVVYFVVFLVLILAAAIAAMSGSKDNDGASKGIGNLIAVLFRVFLEIFIWKTILDNNQTHYEIDEYGYRSRRPNARRSEIAKLRNKDGKGDAADKSIIASIYDFVFGPPRIAPDPLANKQEVASYLKEQKGIVCTAELQALAGWRREEADNFMTECLAHFNGRAEVSPNGTLYADFPDINRRKNEENSAPVVYFWNEYEPPYQLNGNTSGKNALIVFMNIFNLAGSLFILSQGEEFMDSALAAWLGWIPLVYSLLFFLIPFVRYLYLIPRHREQHKTNIRKRLMRLIFQSSNPRITLSQLIATANADKAEEKLDKKTIEDIMQDLIYDFNGEIVIRESDAEVEYDFSTLARELDDTEEARQDKNADDRLGNVIMEA